MKSLLLGLFLASSVIATQAYGASEHCKADAEKLCADVEKGEGRVVRCLKEKEDQVSAECKTDLNVKKEAMKEVASACEADIKKHCGDTKVGGGRIAKCLRQNKNSLSEPCKAEMKEQRGKFRK